MSLHTAINLLIALTLIIGPLLFGWSVVRTKRLDDANSQALGIRQREDHQRLDILAATDQGAPARATGIRSDRRPEDGL